MDEPWQTEHFSSRRIGHGRKGKGTGGGGKGGSFDPRRTYGVYELNCGGGLEGVAVLAGSRRVLEEVVRGFDEEGEEEEEDGDEEDENDDDDGTGGKDESDDEDDEQPKTSLELADEKERRRFAAFEKNSFRPPKFWLRWRGVVSKEVDELRGTSVKKIVEVNGGYLVYGGNECASFQGTISCEALGWRNVKVMGKKVLSRARECSVGWSDVGLDG
ncbi:hypothetical protein M409DRAFT_49673 [Zasmidium cellare ATCC 36951]|uniref:Uncharacterized protein n=1 Tax=Zasmidium cellare ATCC 36951 TaxID=1080233 RepID=A0A6A6D281_ZASCE|nr:uncharacterized protein M409DRAFT_49673 [Zasmidium cellare ATCC 36951]KAF2173193.1 hypothetical protein M409DRAFT_49673 [Zasmidium cellare ATCC 36951]